MIFASCVWRATDGAAHRRSARGFTGRPMLATPSAQAHPWRLHLGIHPMFGALPGLDRTTTIWAQGQFQA